MASGSIEPEELPRERYRWSENSKVYTRKVFKSNRNKQLNPSVVATNTQPNENNNINTLEKTRVDGGDTTTNIGDGGTTTKIDVANGTTDISDNLNDGDVPTQGKHSPLKVSAEVSHWPQPQQIPSRLEVDAQQKHSSPEVCVEEAHSPQPQQKSPRLEDNTQQKHSSPKVPAEGAHLSQPQQDSPLREHDTQHEHSSPKVTAEEAHSSQPQLDSPRLGTVSADSSNHDRPEPPAFNGHDENLANGLVIPRINRVHDRINITVSSTTSKPEVRKLKRMLESELDRVKKMAKVLEVKELQLNGHSNSRVDQDVEGHGVFTSAPVGSLQYPVNGLENNLSGGMQMNSEMGSAGFNGSRPFRRLSVSIMNNNVMGEVVEKEKRTPKANSYYRNSEFLLGKEKLPPAESNKKSKSAGSKKHGGRELDYGFGIDKQIFKSCNNLLQKLIKHKHGWVFKEPVDVRKLGLHDYFDIIKHPMDLGTVKTRLTNNWYKTPREFAEDVRLTFRNAMTYNPEGQDVNVMAKDLLRVFEEKWPTIETEYDRKLRYELICDVGVPTPTSRRSCAPAPPWAAPRLSQHPQFIQEARHLERSQSMPVPPESRPKVVYSMGRTRTPKKPKANDPNKRDMTFDEKQRLSTNLQGLPSEKLDAIVQIIKKRNSTLSQHDDEIEVDIDSVDAETLWELDRFVTNYKKTLSKRKRKAELAHQARELALQARGAAPPPVKETIPASVNIETANETLQDTGNVASSPHVQQERHSDNGSSSSSSSSSSSDSGSSSSDSDSDSSSSDGGQ